MYGCIKFVEFHTNLWIYEVHQRAKICLCVCELVFVLDVEPSAATATASQKNMSESNAEWEMDAMKFISYIECWKEIEKEARSHTYKHTQQLLWNWNIIHFSDDNRARRWMSQRKQTTVFVCHLLFASIIHYARRIGLLYCFLFFSFRLASSWSSWLLLLLIFVFGGRHQIIHCKSIPQAKRIAMSNAFVRSIDRLIGIQNAGWQVSIALHLIFDYFIPPRCVFTVSIFMLGAHCEAIDWNSNINLTGDQLNDCFLFIWFVCSLSLYLSLPCSHCTHNLMDGTFVISQLLFFNSKSEVIEHFLTFKRYCTVYAWIIEN